MYNSLD